MQPQKYSTVRNPIGIIALFIGLTEVGFGVVVSLASENIPIGLLSVLVYFMVGFAVLCAVWFFALLTWRPENLYSPGDYREDTSFIEMIGFRSKQVFSVREPTDEPAQELDVVSFPQETLKRIAERLDLPLLHFLLRAANQPMELVELGDSLRKELADLYDFLQEPTEHTKIFTFGYFTSMAGSFNKLLFDMDSKEGKITLIIEPETLRVLAGSLGERLQKK